ncbi:GNAT family N-acetyltransferase [Streptomyces sp. NPDC005648]|uniref:GNAT family N-acetyltransferase n=1 Tax=Streptomyces sp. NPDC005648 TaxID=3157044 RepID=UPI0033A3EF6A
MDEIDMAGGAPVTVRELLPEDEKGVARLFAACGDYFTAATGSAALPADVQSLYYALPEGAEFDQKRLLVVCRGGGVVGLVDLVDRYPDAESCSVGLFVVAPEARGEGVGSAVAGRLIEEGAGRGTRKVAAACPGGWEPGLGFLRGLGFAVGEPEELTGETLGNRTRQPAETGLRRAWLNLG